MLFHFRGIALQPSLRTKDHRIFEHAGVDMVDMNTAGYEGLESQLMIEGTIDCQRILESVLLLVVSCVHKRQRRFEVPHVGDSQEHRQRPVKTL